MPRPVDAVTLSDPYPYYAQLVREQPFAHQPDSGLWVAAGAEAVLEVLREGRLKARPPAEPVPAGIVGTPAGEVFGQLVRMTDGPTRDRLKSVVRQTLAEVDPARVRELAGRQARLVLEGEFSFWELMFGVPARVVAQLAGLDDGQDAEASRLIGEFVLCIPAGATAEHQRRAAVAAGRLQELLGPRLRGDGLLGELVRIAQRESWAQTAPLLANGIGLLSQTYDATAALIGNTLVALARGVPAEGGLEPVIREVVRHDAPIQNTRRFAAEPVRVQGQEVAAGAAVLVLLAAANRDPAVNPQPEVFRTDRQIPVVFTFSAGAHRCPGEEIAVAITAGVVGEISRSVTLLEKVPADVRYLPSPNARIPELN